MQRTLEEEFRVPVRWVETHSRTTFENAVDSAAILIPAGIRTALVVTHAWHVPRALESFKATALAAVGAPTAYTQPPGEVQLRDFLPRPSALLTTYFAAHEWVGRAWYLVLGRLAAPA
jgi:uncharacterized SAM-binding protein YcdF (DUF218 family)